jgi:DNA-binding NarL/FixJ family response regulator
VGDSTRAASTLRKAVAEWNALEAPYEAARARELLGVAYRRLGDEDGERLELSAAARTYKELGATPDLLRLEGPANADGPLSPREVEVLRLVARGASNKVIAETLVISQKTVERHLSSIFTKLGLSSRSAATAYAFEHGLTG